MNTKEKMIKSFLEDINGWKSVLDSSPDLIAILDAEFKIVWVNKAMAKSLNISSDSCLGLKCFEAVHKTGSPLKNCPHAKMMSECQEYTEEVNEENLGGCFIVTASPIKDESGDILGSIHIARDISEHKKAEGKIQRLADVVESSDDAIITKSLEGTILSWNMGAEQIYGYSAEEILGAPISILEPFDLSRETENLVNKIKNGEKIDHYETLRLRKDNEMINVSVTLSPVFDVSGELVAISTIARDITEQKSAEKQKQVLLEQLQQLNEELESSNEELQATNEELYVSNEELQDTTEELQVANEELQATTEELHASNEELQNTTEHLRQQSEDLAHLNQELHESEQRMNRSQGIGHIGSWELDLVKNQLFWSDEVYRIFGLQPQEFDATYDAFLEAIHPDDREAVDAAYSGSLSEGKDTYEIEHRVVRKSTGEVRIVYEKCEHIRDESGQIVKSVGMVHDITERKQAEEELKEAKILAENRQKYLEIIFENAPTGIMIMDGSDNHISYINPEGQRLFGIKQENKLQAEEYYKKLKFLNPDGGYISKNELPINRALLNGEKVHNVEVLIETQNNGRINVFTSANPVYDDNNEILAGIGIFRDITELKEAEESILWNQQRNELLAEVSSRLLTTENPQDIIDDLCQKTMEFMECDVFFNYLVDEQKECLHLNAYAGIPDEEAKKIEWLDYGVAVCGCAALESRRIIAENIFETPDPRTDLVKSYGVQAYACHPLMSGGISIGTLSFGTNSRTRFTDEELELMKAVADQISIAMNRLISNLALKESEEAAINAQNQWEHTFEAVPDLIAILGTDYKVIRANKAMADRFGITPEECIGLTCYDVVHGMDEPPSFCPHRQLLEDGSEHTEEIHEDSLGGDFLVSASPLHDSEGKLIGSVHVARDISERKKKEKELYQLNKSYRALSNSSQAMISAENELEYLESVCDIVVEDCGHSMVWIGYAENDENKTVQPMAYAGFDEGYIETLNITWSDNERGQGPTGTAIRTQKPSACKNMLTDPKFAPWREAAVKRGYSSSLVLPLIFEGKALGALSIYSTKADSFSEDEIKLLTELAENLAYGINVIRLRVAREQAENALREAKDNLEKQVKERTLELEEAYESLKFANAYNRSLIEASLDPLVTIGPDGKITDVNYSTEQVTGYSRKEIIGTDFSDYFTEPEKARNGYREVFREGQVFDYPLEIKHKDGHITPVLYNASVYLDEDGEVIGIFAAARDMTESKKTEEIIQRLANVVESSEDAIITKSLDGVITSWNIGAEQIYGYSAEEILGKPISTMEPDNFKGETEELIEMIKQGERIHHYETSRLKKDGNIINISITLSPVFDTSGELVAISTIARDITERKKAEKELERASKYNRSLIEASLDPLVTIGPDGKITDVNGATETVTGYSRDELIGTDFSDYFTDPKKARKGYQEVFQEGHVLDYPLEIKHKDGHTTPVLYNASVYKDETGEVIGVFAAARDITERKKAEKELERASKYNRSLIEASLDPLVTIGPDGRITDVNMATELVTGSYRDELVGNDFSNYFTNPEKARKGYQEVFREGRVFDYPLGIKHKDGHVTPVLYNASVYKDETGEVIGVFAAARDITERKNAEKMLKLKLEELARSNAELEQFAYVSSHDLQEPLRMIGSYLQLLQRRYQGQLDDKADKYIDFAVDGASRMQNLINDLLEFSRVTTRAKEFEPTDCELILNHTLSNLEVSIKENEAIISHDHLPTVMADSTQLLQVFQNLISNALKFRSEKSPKIYISAEKDGDQWIFSVADNGIGIDPKHSERIFEVFKRLHKRREYPGTGIGLSICKKIVERHGGHIWVRSKPNEGAIFYFTLPN